MKHLTKRQKQTIYLLSQGFTTVATARFLGLDPKTIEGYRVCAYRTLGIDNPVDLTHWAIRNHLVPVK